MKPGMIAGEGQQQFTRQTDRPTAITEIVLKLVTQNLHVLLTVIATNGRPATV
jgi:hypothetical protein